MAKAHLWLVLRGDSLLNEHMHGHGRSNHHERPVIYQLLVRTFGNTNQTRKINGTIEENGCGKFVDINHAALKSLREMGFTHLWLTGVLEQASGTSYPNRPADHPALLKGIAGSPYAIKDYFDVCPDYAVVPEQRLEEFKELLGRCKDHDLKVIIDFVPNHVARSYHSDVRPDLSFGVGDDVSVFFARDNQFFYLRPDHAGGGPPLKLPGAKGLVVYEPESVVGKVTGNNAVTWMPGVCDWYETVKLNYGHDFTRGRDTRNLPASHAAVGEVPKTWRMMDEILAYWQEMGVDGFRCDMAHMVPMEFWHWIVKRCRRREASVFFCAEAYDNDPAKLCDGHVLNELLRAGFDAVYDDPVYDLLEGIYDDGKWANDIDHEIFTGVRFHKSLRYAENHDEVRLANPKVWGGHGMTIGKPVTALLFAMGQGPLMMYHGQEIGESGDSPIGFAGDNARTSIFDYGSMAEFPKWVNGGACDGGGLSDEQRHLRVWYGKLIKALAAPAFRRGCFYGLNHENQQNPHFGRLDGEFCSGHWIYAFLRRDSRSSDAYLVVVNLHPTIAMESLKVRIPSDARMFAGRSDVPVWKFRDRLDSEWSGEATLEQLQHEGLVLPRLEACSVMLMQIG